MKASEAIRRARKHQNHINRLLAPINKRLEKILNEEGVHIVDQAGDGFCVCYSNTSNNSYNASLGFLDIDMALQLKKEDLMQVLLNAHI